MERPLGVADAKFSRDAFAKVRHCLLCAADIIQALYERIFLYIIDTINSVIVSKTKEGM